MVRTSTTAGILWLLAVTVAAIWPQGRLLGGEHQTLTAPRAAGPLVGWGDNLDSQATVPDGHFVAVAAGGYHSLALRNDGSLVAWGDNSFGQLDLPAGDSFVAVAAGGLHSLALRKDGSLAAWGCNDRGEATVPDGNNFVAVAAGWDHNLALRNDGSLAAWGSNFQGQATVPDGEKFVAVAAGWSHSLGLRNDGSLVGWGNDFYGQRNTPAGNSFVAVAAGGYHSLALRNDGSLAVWGSDQHGLMRIPAGKNFVAVAAGAFHNLALRDDGSLAGWGSNQYGQATVPAGNEFVAVAAGHLHGLAIRSGNQPPVAMAYALDEEGQRQTEITVECAGSGGTFVWLDGSDSYDPDNDQLTYRWSVSPDSGHLLDPEAPSSQGVFRRGVHLVTLAVEDGQDGYDTADVTITVADRTPPVVYMTTDVASLWPPNQKMVPVTISAFATDTCTLPEALIISCRVSSSQPDDTVGSGEHVGDVHGEDGFTEPLDVDLVHVGDGVYEATILLRAERDDNDKGGRVYSIIIDAMDPGGNASSASCTVLVPHNRRGR